MNPKPGRLFRTLCLAMRFDPDIMAEAPLRDRAAVAGDAAFLAVVGLISGIAWTNFWWRYAPPPVAILFGGIAGLFVPLMDVAIGAADLQLEGVLRRPDARRRRGWGRLGLRLLVSVVLSQATSVGVELVIYRQAIAQQEERDVQAHNRATEDRFARRENELRQQRFGGLVEDKKRLERLVDDTTGPLDRALETQATAKHAAEEAQARAEMELHGAPGFPAGPGKRYKKALADAQAAQAELTRANAQVAILQPRVDQAKNQLRAVTDRLASAEASISVEIGALEQEKKLQLEVVRSDPLLDQNALQEVFGDPQIGRAAWRFSLLMNAVLLVLELGYLLVRLGFAPASVYTVLVIKDTRLRAERAAADYRRESEALRAGVGAAPPVLPPVKLIAWDGNRNAA